MRARHWQKCASAALCLLMALWLSVRPSLAGRGGLANWADLQGVWTGQGLGENGAFTALDVVEALYGGQYLKIHHQERKDNVLVRDQIWIYAVEGERLTLHLYDGAGRHGKASGEFDVDAPSLDVADTAFEQVLERRGTTLSGKRLAIAGGAATPTATWTLSRTNTAPAPETGTPPPALSTLVGSFQGSGTSMEGDLKISETTTTTLPNQLVTSQVIMTFNSGKVSALVAVYGLLANQPFRHTFAQDGTVLDFTGTATPTGHLNFRTPAPPHGEIEVSIDTTATGYQMKTQLHRIGGDPVNVAQLDLLHVGPHP